jgi:hypothetical protein
VKSCTQEYPLDFHYFERFSKLAWKMGSVESFVLMRFTVRQREKTTGESSKDFFQLRGSMVRKHSDIAGAVG